jgi:hypothetical protein
MRLFRCKVLHAQVKKKEEDGVFWWWKKEEDFDLSFKSASGGN